MYWFDGFFTSHDNRLFLRSRTTLLHHSRDLIDDWQTAPLAENESRPLVARRVPHLLLPDAPPPSRSWSAPAHGTPPLTPRMGGNQASDEWGMEQLSQGNPEYKTCVKLDQAEVEHRGLWNWKILEWLGRWRDRSGWRWYGESRTLWTVDCLSRVIPGWGWVKTGYRWGKTGFTAPGTAWGYWVVELHGGCTQDLPSLAWVHPVSYHCRRFHPRSSLGTKEAGSSPWYCCLLNFFRASPNSNSE